MNKLQTRLRAVEEEHAEEFVNENFQIHQEKRRDNALILLGGFNVVNRISQSLSSELMRALITFQEEKIYESLGYETFVDFLNNSEHSPMTKNQFYDRKSLIEKEGDITFDLLNSLSMPVSKRKLLGAGNIQLDGEKVIILDHETGEEISINRTDTVRMTEIITALADANADKSKKIERGREDNERLKRKVTDLETAFETERLTPNAAERDEIENCYMVVGSMLNRLNSLLEDAPIVRVAQFEDRNLRVLAAQYQQLNDTIAKKLPGGTGAALTETDEDRLASLLDDED